MRKAVPSVITKVKARQILDSRGIPTVEVDLYTNKGMFRASAPSGDPTGMYGFCFLLFSFLFSIALFGCREFISEGTKIQIDF